LSHHAGGCQVPCESPCTKHTKMSDLAYTTLRQAPIVDFSLNG
jgi:hypothetical protein